MVTQDLLSILRCPCCRDGDLRRVDDGNDRSRAGVACDRCGRCYPTRSGVPILLPDEGRHPDEDEGTARRPASDLLTAESPWLPERLRRTTRVLRTQGALPLLSKTRAACRTGLEQALPVLRRGPTYLCPCCGARARFLTYRGRPRAKCPRCGAKERDRLLVLVLRETLRRMAAPPSVLHIAPEAIVREFIAPRSRGYVGTDLTRGLSSYAGHLAAATDLTRLAFRSGTFDLVVASHVLEHIADDRAAAREVLRVLKPGGLALLPVPVVHGGATVEYGHPDPREEMHVRAPGPDYFDRFADCGFDVVLRRSSSYPDEHQLRSHHVHRRAVSRDLGPATKASTGSGYEQIVPLCSKPLGGPWTSRAEARPA